MERRRSGTARSPSAVTSLAAEGLRRRPAPRRPVRCTATSAGRPTRPTPPWWSGCCGSREPSDPADEAIVLGSRCRAPRGAGLAGVGAFGPDADPDLAQAFVYLAAKARHTWRRAVLA